jgi:hypothetical protein
MTPEEFEEKMKAIIQDGNDDLESIHCDMDNLMCEALVSLGYVGGCCGVQ